MDSAYRSLSKEILFGTFENVVRLVRDEGADVNEKDVYGLTPLIEATLKEDKQIVEFLLEHGARVDQEDISGQTALQWSVNRHVMPLIELLLKKGADPNHYSADGQPILVMPLLRGQTDTVERLIAYGAKLTFAEDFIHAKLIGHRYELIGKANIVNARGQFIDVAHEGFYLEFSVHRIATALRAFMQSEQGALFISYRIVMNKILRALHMASTLAQYKYITRKTELEELLLRQALKEELLVVPIAYEGHAITLVRYGNLLAKCDRGVKQIVDTVVIYEIGNPYALTENFWIALVSDQKTSEYINEELKNLLSLRPLSTLPARYQLSGNCSWANVEASVPAMMFLLMLGRDLGNRGVIAALKASVMKYYDQWIEYDKDKVLENCLEQFPNMDKKRQASMVSILAAVLFQRCSAAHQKETKRAKKILSLLMLDPYRYILKSYVQVYYNKAAGKAGQHFVQLLKACKIDPKHIMLPG